MDNGQALAPAFSYEDLLSLAENPAWPSFSRNHRLSVEAVSFLKQLHDDALGDDLAGIDSRDMIALAHELWAWSDTRKGSQRLIRLRRATGAEGRDLGRDVLEIIGPDLPFLVDSTMNEIADQGLVARAMFHPIVVTSRDAEGVRTEYGTEIQESIIQIHLEPVAEHKRDRLILGVNAALEDVRISVQDWDAMRRRMLACASEVEGLPARSKEEREEIEEAGEFLKWLCAENYVFQGARVYHYALNADGSLAAEEPEIIATSGLGILRDEARSVLRRGSEPTILTPEVRAFLQESDPLIVGKSNLVSLVHRRVRCDYIGIKRYNANREVIGETRFVGLYTSEAYRRMAQDVPRLRRKLRRVIDRAGKVPGSHSDKRLQNILETYPRDELFQITENELLRTSLGILHLMDRPRAKLFVRRDKFDRFVSALVFVPREKYNSAIRVRIGNLLRDAFQGRLSAFYPDFSDAPLARIHYIIGLNPDHPEPDIPELERQIQSFAHTWEDDFERACLAHGLAPARISKYADAFTAGYRETFDGDEALRDIDELEKLDADADGVRVRAFRLAGDPSESLRCKIYSRVGQIELSRAFPILENMGLFIKSETPHRVMPGSITAGTEQNIVAPLWVHDLSMVSRDGQEIALERVESSFEESFIAGWTGRTENDGFNRLTLKLGISWRQSALIRAFARFRQQSGLDPSQLVQEDAANSYPDIIATILQIFETRFDPDLALDKPGREAALEQLNQSLTQALLRVTSLDHDRALRRIGNLVNAMLRTNYYQVAADGHSKTHFSFKILSRQLDELPLPKPLYEIFVWSPEVEAVHLRFGKVARGGLRWSDRRDDFRTEVLGLVKAQQVKNAVIVPVGSKGGFFPKQLPARDPKARMEAAQSAYRVFLRGLLDLTDNIVQGAIVHPERTQRWDDDDPYLVVAADKGTATFSDIANNMAAQYGFWLGDAFASGGSVGYDHKKMGITARGAWEAVKRHFREIGKNIQEEPFSVLGVGDMSGDVFGNGMLLSRQIHLVAAFDHRDIFLDPKPDAARSWEERLRLYRTPGVTWADYDRSLLSEGGGVFSRSSRSIPLNDAIRSLTGLTGETTTPDELVSALLRAPVELIYFGGIGTFVKSSQESHASAGDKANDSIRVDAQDLRCQVIGEGANLGLTQAARIEFARQGGRLNTDAVDNSAGVDTSDHEVNIKILLRIVESAGQMTLEKRDELLREMTESVADLVLADNIDQTFCVSLAQSTSAEDLDAYERLMQKLEKAGRLDRRVEGLPSNAQIAKLASQKLGLTRPEISVVMAYGKIELFDHLLGSDVIDDPAFEQSLQAYFPPQLSAYREQMAQHRLRREIIATQLANDIVNIGGPLFIHRVNEASDAEVPVIARAFEIARRIFRLDTLISQIHALDNKAPASAQIALFQDLTHFLRRQTFWLARRARTSGHPESIQALIDNFQPLIDQFRETSALGVSPFDSHRIETRAAELVGIGAPADLAREAAKLKALTSALDIADLSRRRQWPMEPTSNLYFHLGGELCLDELRETARNLVSDQHWDRVAARRAVEDFYAQQILATETAILAAQTRGNPGAQNWRDAGTNFLADRPGCSERIRATLDALEASGPWSFAKITIAGAQTRETLSNIKS